MSGAEIMNERKKRILQAVTDDYISTAEPVGSRTIARRYNLGISPATIRNEMADLEESGYLEQPHTSAGRIPSDKGYRFYVDSLMQARPLSKEQQARIYRELKRRQHEIEALIQHTAKLIADLTSCAALILCPRLQDRVLKHIELIPLNEENVLVILVTSPGFVETRVVEIPHPISAEELRKVAEFLNAHLQGMIVSNIRVSLLKQLHLELVRYNSLLEGTLDLIIKTIRKSGKERVYREGTMHILEQPEFRDIEKVKPLFEFLGEDDTLIDILGNASSHGELRVVIGKEHEMAEIRDCSMISAPYGIRGNIVGILAVLGPTRMDYARIISLVEFVAGLLSDTLTEIDAS
ncbi:MAG TPA: heat-inducible transcription repressor HrcA [Firmicutes bacterium]|nr:heat-inducible transcription repressor HrcA [Bacillota bacterium]